MTASSNPPGPTSDAGLRRVVLGVALANLAYFAVEFGVARRIGSVSLFADSVDFLEDAAVNFLIAVALGWSVKNRARIGMLLAAILLVPAAALLWTAWHQDPRADSAGALESLGHGSRRARGESRLRVRAGEVPPSRRQLDASGVSVGTQ